MSLGASYLKTYNHTRLTWFGESLERLGRAVEEVVKKGEGAQVGERTRKRENGGEEALFIGQN